MAVFLLNALSALQKGLPPLQPSKQDRLTKMASLVSPLFLPFDKKEMSFGRHPMQTLFHLVLRSISGEHTNLSQALEAIPKKLRDDMYFEVWNQATDPNKGGNRWGEYNALNNHPRLLHVIKVVVDKTLDRLSPDQKNALFSTIYEIAGRPQTSDLQWGEHHAKNDTERLICALHRHQHLEIPGKTISFYSDLEKGIQQPSCAFHLNRSELSRGQIGFHNGIGCSLEDAKEHALKLSDLVHRRNLHCTYSATIGIQQDLASAILGQGGTVTPAVVKLLEQWQEFFEKTESDRLLQICHSRGAIEVNNALRQLPPELQQRIIVISIAPACLIESNLAYKVINLVIPSDPVVQMAANRHLLESPHTYRLDDHTDTPENPHNMHGSSFLEMLGPLMSYFIDNNDISL